MRNRKRSRSTRRERRSSSSTCSAIPRAGGFGETLGNDVSLLRRTIEPMPSAARGARARGACSSSTRAKATAPICRTRRQAKVERGAPSMRIGAPGPMGRILVRGEAGHDIIPELYPAAGRAGHRQAGQGRVLRHRSARDPAEPRHRAAHRLRRDHRGLRQHHGARGQRPRLRLPRPEDCVGSYFPEFHEMGLRMIKAQGGIFGWVRTRRAFSRRSS